MATTPNVMLKPDHPAGPYVILDRVRSGKRGTGNSVQLLVEKDGEGAQWNVLQETTDAITEANQMCTPCVIWENARCGESACGVSVQ